MDEFLSLFLDQVPSLYRTPPGDSMATSSAPPLLAGPGLRNRDPLSNLPFIPAKVDFGVSRRSRSQRGLGSEARRAANRSIAATRAMWEGSFKEHLLPTGEVHDSSWEQSGPLQRKVVEKIFWVHWNLWQKTNRPQGEDAFMRVVKTAPQAYGGGPHLEVGLSRGSLCPAVVEDMSVPPPGVPII